MLIAMPQQALHDPILDVIAKLNGNHPGILEHRAGIYQIGHFNGGHVFRGFEQYPPFSDSPEGKYRGCYGVCDSIENLLECFPELENSDRQFAVTVTEVKKSNQPEEGGWRWHKWGHYIGNHDPQHEYLYDEVGIESVLCYHIFELVDYNALSIEELKARYQMKRFIPYDVECRDWVEIDADHQRAAIINAMKW